MRLRTDSCIPDLLVFPEDTSDVATIVLINHQVSRTTWLLHQE